MHRNRLLLAAALPLALGACTVHSANEPAAPAHHSAPPPRYSEPAPRYSDPEPRYSEPARRTSTPARNSSRPAVDRAPTSGRWEKLGVTTVNGSNDHDKVDVGRAEGSFKSLRLEVNKSDLLMHDVVVHFVDGTTFSPGTRQVFREGATSSVIDLPGDRRRIQSVNFRYTDRAGGGAAQVEVWGR